MMETIFGANWRTTVFGTIFATCIVISLNPHLVDFLGDAKTTIIGIATLVSGVATFMNAKDKQVTGNGSDSAPQKVAQSDGTNKVIGIALAFFLCSAFVGCVTDPTTGKLVWNPTAFQAQPGVQNAEKVAGQILLTELGAIAQNEVNGGKFDAAWGLTQGLNILSTSVANLPNNQAAQVISKTAMDYAGDTSMQPVAKKLAQAYLNVNPQTPQQKVATVQAIANGAQGGIVQATNNLP